MTRPPMAHRATPPACPLGCPSLWPADPYPDARDSRPTLAEVAVGFAVFAAILAALIAAATGVTP